MDSAQLKAEIKQAVGEVAAALASQLDGKEVVVIVPVVVLSASPVTVLPEKRNG